MFKSLEVKYPKFYQVFRFIIVIIASVLYAWNLRCFAKVADLLPGGFSGVSLLFQTIGLRFFNISIPFTIFNVALNIFPAYIAYRYIGKKFTIYSIVVRRNRGCHPAECGFTDFRERAVGSRSERTGGI